MLCSFIFKWMKKWEEEAGDNQSFYKTIVKVDNKFKCILRENIMTVHLRLIFIDYQYLLGVSLVA
jgi:hypothetical protein